MSEAEMIFSMRKARDRQANAEARQERRKVDPAVRAIRAVQLVAQQEAMQAARQANASTPTDPVEIVMAALNSLAPSMRRKVVQLFAGRYNFGKLQDRAREILATSNADVQKAAKVAGE